jgi:hypothetical protein
MLVITTAAFGTVAPEGSLMVPRIVPYVDWAAKKAGAKSMPPVNKVK